MPLVGADGPGGPENRAAAAHDRRRGGRRRGDGLLARTARPASSRTRMGAGVGTVTTRRRRGTKWSRWTNAPTTNCSRRRGRSLKPSRSSTAATWRRCSRTSRAAPATRARRRPDRGDVRRGARGAHRHRPDRGPAVAWLYGIARRQLAHAARRGAVEDSARRGLGVPPLTLTDAGIERVEELVDTDAAAAMLSGGPRGDAGGTARGRSRARPRRARVRRHRPRAEDSEAVVRKRVSRGLAGLRSRLEGVHDRPGLRARGRAALPRLVAAPPGGRGELDLAPAAAADPGRCRRVLAAVLAAVGMFVPRPAPRNERPVNRPCRRPASRCPVAGLAQPCAGRRQSCRGHASPPTRCSPSICAAAAACRPAADRLPALVRGDGQHPIGTWLPVGDYAPLSERRPHNSQPADRRAHGST